MSTESEISTCDLCSLVLGWNSDSKSSDISSAFHSLANNTDTAQNSTVCSICLGVLQSGLSERVVQDVSEKFNCSRFDANSFNLAVSLPPSCVVREKVGKLLKREAIGDDNSGDEVFQLSLKDACRLCYQEALERAFSSNNICYNAQSDFTIFVTFENHKADKFCDFLRRCFPNRFSAKKRRRHGRNGRTTTDGNNSEWSRVAISEILPLVTKSTVDDNELSDRLRDLTDQCTFVTSFSRTPLFIGGRYCKFSRHLSQTPWIVDGVRRGETSVQELICDHLVKSIEPEDVKFTSSGREDTDVRMLGDGRPFAIQFINPRRKRTVDQAEVDELQRCVNGSSKDVRVCQLRVVSPQEFTTLKVGEEEKQKTYVALVWSPNSLSEESMKKRILDLKHLGPIQINQKTPIRVLHRRPLAVRKRTIGSFGVILLDEHRFQLRLTTQAGTYVKEFVYGDFGRTQPSLSDLLGGIPVDILELDVERIDLAWP